MGADHKREVIQTTLEHVARTVRCNITEMKFSIKEVNIDISGVG